MNKTRLFCFTYAGGTKSFFDEIEKDLSGIELCAFDYAGHGERYKEPFYDSFEELADDMFNKISNRLDDNYALFGYSMGSITTVEVLRIIHKLGLQLPSHIFICAHEPHTKSELLGFKPDELDIWVKERTISFGDVPEKLYNNNVFWRTYLPIYRSDYTIIGKYEFEKLDLRASIPLTVFYSETDTPIKDMKQWEEFFTETVEYIRFDGNHFFIREHHVEMAQIIKDRLGVVV